MSVKILDDSQLPLILDDLPNFKLKLQESMDLGGSGSDRACLETGHKFIKELQLLISLNSPNEKQREELYALYDFKFNQICQTVFKDREWPTPSDIEQEFVDEELDLNTQYLYNELCYRHALARLTGSNFDTGQLLEKSWENYVDIFDIILNSKNNIPLPVPWIWDIIDEFIYQFYFACRWRRTVKSEDETIRKHFEDSDSNFWNLEYVLNTFQKLIEKSNILVNGSSPKLNASDDGSATTNEYFGYFAIVGLQRVYILIGDFEKAVQTIQSIDFQTLLVFSKAVPSYLTLFYYTGFSYLMTKRFKEAVRLFEAIIIFINKYKPFMTKTFQFDNMCKQLERTLALFVLALVFYPTEVDDSIYQLLKETNFQSKDRKEHLADKLEKLNKFDDQTFFDLFNYGVPKIIQPIKTLDDFRKMGFDHNSSEIVNRSRNGLFEEFKQVQSLNNISSVLKLYTRIQLSKVAKLLNISIDELKKNLDLYKLRNNSPLLDVPFEQTIIKQFIGVQQQIDFTVEGDILTVTEVLPAKNYTAYFAQTSAKFEEIINDLEALIKFD